MTKNISENFKGCCGGNGATGCCNEPQGEMVTAAEFHSAYKRQTRGYFDMFKNLPLELQTVENRLSIMLAAANAKGAKPIPKSLCDALGMNIGFAVGNDFVRTPDVS